MKNLLILSLLILLAITTSAQVGINSDNSEPDVSAMLDIKSTTKGMLIPRMTSTQRTAITSPATGLLVFDTTTGSFWFYNATVWTDLSSTGAPDHITDADSDTKIQVEESNDEDIIRFDMAGTEHFQMNNGRLEVLNTGQSVFIGEGAGANDDFTTNRNTAIGGSALNSNTTGERNVANGFAALNFNTTGNYNVANGSEALFFNTIGAYNLANGFNALYFNTTGSNNVANGTAALFFNTTGNYNVANGYAALYSNDSGSQNTAVGYQADVSTGILTNATAIGANALVSQDSSLVLGNAAKVGIGTSSPDAKLHIIGDVKIVDGNQGTGKVLSSDSTGIASWQNPTTTIMKDADNDTKVQVEESNDDDIIRFDMAGTEFIRMDSGHIEIVNTGKSVFIGQGAGANDDFTDNKNTAVGSDALSNNTTGDHNVATGLAALQFNTTGVQNTANGGLTLWSNTTGIRNTAHGFGALFKNSIGSENTAIGYQADVSIGNLTNATAIGANATVSQDSSLVLGNAAKVGIGTSSPDAKLHVVGRTCIDGDRIEFVNTGNSVFIGAGAGANDDFSNNHNTAVGDSALYFNSTGFGNVANGKEALQSNTTGYYNVASGYRALQSNTTGLSNVANGTSALNSNTTGEYNVATGTGALLQNTTGKHNIAIGNVPLLHNTTGDFNVATGTGALLHNTTGDNNVANGVDALKANTAGDNNTAIGYKADVSTGNLTNATAIGANVTVSQSNSLVLGNNANVGIGTSSPVHKLEVYGGNIAMNNADTLYFLREDKTPAGFIKPYNEGMMLAENRGGNHTSITIGHSDIAFEAGTTERIRILQNGNVGIGTATPGAKLDVNGELKMSGGNINMNSKWVSGDGSNNGLRIAPNNNIGVGGSTANYHFFITGSNGNDWAFGIDPDGDNASEFGVKSDGDIYADLHANTDPLPVNIVFDNEDHLIRYAVSSRRYKKNIKAANLSQDVGKFLSLELKAFQFNNTEDKRFDYGFIAEEVDALGLHMPLSWKKDGQVESLYFDHIAFYNFAALQQHRDRIQILEEKISRQDEKIEVIEGELTELKAMIQQLQTANLSAQNK